MTRRDVVKATVGTETATAPPYISKRTAAALLEISERTIERLIARGDLCARRIPRTRLVRLRREDVEGLLVNAEPPQVD